jgi:hypothetical protein
MNATGVKLNRQELRNAAYFGHFKTSMYELAFQHLPQWRNWGVFTENDIARMNEVELTSEVSQMILKGITGKTQTSLDRQYEAKDEAYVEKKEVERRFQILIAHIDEGLGKDMQFLPFKRKALIYPLFAIVYHGLFKIGSQLTKKPEEPLPNKFFGNLKAAGERISKNKVPENVLQAAARRTTHISSRTILFDYLLKESGLAPK